MKQKVGSILLLLSFIAMLLHDIAPHHHHASTVVHEEGLVQKDNDAHGCFEVTNDSGCHNNKDVFVGIDNNHHECPHHLHHCNIRNYEAFRAYSFLTQVQLSSSFFLLKDFNDLSQSNIIFTQLVFERLENSPILPQPHLLSSLTLRAPPSLA